MLESSLHTSIHITYLQIDLKLGMRVGVCKSRFIRESEKDSLRATDHESWSVSHICGSREFPSGLWIVPGTYYVCGRCFALSVSPRVLPQPSSNSSSVDVNPLKR